MTNRAAIVGLALTLLLCGFLVGQTSQTPSPSSRPQHPNINNFKNYDEYVEALASWTVDRRIMDSGKQITVFPAQDSGRYVMFSGPTVRADLFLLDTQTGRIWTRVSYTDLKGEPDVWQIQDRVDNRDELVSWFSQHEAKQK
jgi:hypothetical protein